MTTEAKRKGGGRLVERMKVADVKAHTRTIFRVTVPAGDTFHYVAVSMRRALAQHDRAFRLADGTVPLPALPVSCESVGPVISRSNAEQFSPGR